MNYASESPTVIDCKPPSLTVKQVKALLKEAKKALCRMQTNGVVGDIYKDKLARKYKDDLKLVSKNVRRLAEMHKSQSGTFWGLVCSVLPIFRSSREQAIMTLHLSTAWDTIVRLHADFLRTSEQRDLTYVGYAFSSLSQRLLTTTIPTSTAVSYFADHLGLNDLSPVDRLTRRSGDGTLELETPEIAKQWFKKAYIKEINNIEGFGVKDGLSRAIRLVIFMMDDLGPSPLEQTLGEVRDLLEQSMKLLILLMRFTDISEALDNVEEQLENALTILYHIYTVMCWHMRRVPDMNQSLHARFEMLRFSYDFIQSPSEHLTIIRKSLQAVVADTLDKKAKHWRLLSAEDTVASVAPVISNRFDVCHSLSAILSECRPYELGFDYMPSDDEILAIFNSTMSDVLKPSPEMEELTSVDLLLHELDRLEIPHLMVTRDTVKSHSVGRGAFGIVYKSRIIGRNRFYDAVAVKIPDIGKDKGSYSTSKTILAEAKIWQTLYAKAHAVCQPDQRQLIAPLLGFCVVTDCNYPGLISPFYAYGNLKEFLKNKNPLFSERLHLLLDVAYALKLMHSAHIVYADLKAENVLIDSTGHACLTDFGSAVELPTFGESTVRPTTERRTSERVPGDVSTEKTYQSDIYSFGFLCIEAAIARTPFMDEQELIHDIMTMGSSLAPAGDVHRRLRTLVRNCLDPDPVQRPDANYLISTLKDLVDSL